MCERVNLKRNVYFGPWLSRVQSVTGCFCHPRFCCYRNAWKKKLFTYWQPGIKETGMNQNPNSFFKLVSFGGVTHSLSRQWHGGPKLGTKLTRKMFHLLLLAPWFGINLLHFSLWNGHKSLGDKNRILWHGTTQPRPMLLLGIGGTCEEMCVFPPTRRKLGHRGSNVWRNTGTPALLTVSQLPQVNRPPLPHTLPMMCVRKRKGSPRVPVKLWSHEPRQTFPTFKLILSGILSQWWKTE